MQLLYKTYSLIVRKYNLCGTQYVVLMTDIILVKTEPIMNQSSIRSEQIVKSLRKKYSVLALGWNRGEGRPHKPANEKNFLQIFNLSAPYGSTFRYLAILPMFWA